jgi:hypothetical protein
MMTKSGGVTGARPVTTVRSPLSTSLCAIGTDADYGLLKD